MLNVALCRAPGCLHFPPRFITCCWELTRAREVGPELLQHLTNSCASQGPSDSLTPEVMRK